jgi:hypothetical protein
MLCMYVNDHCPCLTYWITGKILKWCCIFTQCICCSQLHMTESVKLGGIVCCSQLHMAECVKLGGIVCCSTETLLLIENLLIMLLITKFIMHIWHPELYNQYTDYAAGWKVQSFIPSSCKNFFFFFRISRPVLGPPQSPIHGYWGSIGRGTG